MLNTFQLIGRLTKDIELKEIDAPSGKKIVTNITLAQGQKDKTQYYDVSVWDDDAKYLKEKASKGDTIVCNGIIKQEYFQKHNDYKLIAKDIALVCKSRASQEQTATN